MNTDCDICQFLQQKPLQNQLITTDHWTVGVIPDQPYLGRALITLLTHKSSLAQLSDDEWEEFHDIVRKLEPAYEKAFGAVPLNIGCFMNHGFKDDPPHPHVHWQIYPRYKNPVEFAGLTFEDKFYGEFYDNDTLRPVSNEVVKKIVEQLKANLA
jgi:diadenosine tetraphosphate (Ap4A) HIT family hydrolase